MHALNWTSIILISRWGAGMHMLHFVLRKRPIPGHYLHWAESISLYYKDLQRSIKHFMLTQFNSYNAHPLHFHYSTPRYPRFWAWSKASALRLALCCAQALADLVWIMPATCAVKCAASLASFTMSCKGLWRSGKLWRAEFQKVSFQEVSHMTKFNNHPISHSWVYFILLLQDGHVSMFLGKYSHSRKVDLLD